MFSEKRGEVKPSEGRSMFHSAQREKFVCRPGLSEGRHVTGVESIVQLQGRVQTRGGGRESQKSGDKA